MILALQITVVVAVVMGLAGSYLYKSVPGIPLLFGGIAFVALVAYLWLDRTRVKAVLSRRSTLYGLNAAIKAVLILAIAVVANLIFVNYEWKVDVSKGGVHTLSEQSVKVVKEMQKPVTFRVFANPEMVQDFKTVLERYRYASDKVKYEFVDVLRDPMMARTYNITQWDTILVESDNRTARVDGLTNGPLDPKIEEKITNAIIKVSKGAKKKAYFMVGHGERSITEAGQGAFTEIKALMQEGRFDVVELKMVTSAQIPDDAEVVVVAGPKSEFMPFELTALEEYLAKRAGRVLMMVEPDSPPSLQAWLAKFGVAWKTKRVVLEMNELRRSATASPVVPYIETYSRTHPITKTLRGPSVLQLATPVAKMAEAPNGYKVEELFSTSPLSVDVAFQGQRLTVNEKTDKKGPLQIAFAVTGKSDTGAKPDEKKEAAASTPEFRLVVVGDTDFAANGIRAYGMNTDLFMNMLSWISSEEDLIAIRPRDTDDARMELSEFKVGVVQLTSVVFAPLLLLLTAIGVWIYRRRR